MTQRTVAFFALVSLTLAGCASKPPEPTPALQDARAAYALAKEDPDVLRYAARDLEQAQATLERAAGVKDVKDMNSLAYVASAEVQLAEAKAQRNVAEAKIEELSAVKSRVQLEVREAELAASRQQLAQRDAELEALKAEQTSRGMVITLGNVLFATGRSELLPGAMDSIDRLAAYLASEPRKTVRIEGHTDNTGSEQTNQRLSQERAEAVRNSLVARAIDPQRITAIGLASSRPVASNATAEGRQQNRRVEIIIQ